MEKLSGDLVSFFRNQGFVFVSTINNKVGLVKDRDCLKCQSCIHVCPEKSLSL